MNRFNMTDACAPVLPHGSVRDASLARVLFAPTVAFGAWTLAGVGCASAPVVARTTTVQQSVQEGDSIEAPATPARERTVPPTERVVFSDEPAASTETVGGNQADRSLVDALAGSYAADVASLADLQAQRNAKERESTVTAAPSAVTAAPSAVTAAPSAVTAVPSTVTAAPSAVTAAPSTVTAAPSTVTAAPSTVTAAPSAVTAAPSAVTAAPSTVTAANMALELPTATPTDPEALSLLFAASLAMRGGTSTHPMQDWLAFAALALTSPELELPTDFGADLLPAERERITKAHAAFATMGRLLAKGDEIDAGTTEALVVALTSGPKLEIPKIELCTKVESFGRFSPLGTHKFLARTNPRVILYSELQGFASELEGDQYVTRLATRISLESERDGIEVWARNPEWTAVVDASPVRRSEFFVGEIIPISEHLTVGSYLLRVAIRDESTGRVATTSMPIQIVADAAMAAVGD